MSDTYVILKDINTYKKEISRMGNPIGLFYYLAYGGANSELGSVYMFLHLQVKFAQLFIKRI